MSTDHLNSSSSDTQDLLAEALQILRKPPPSPPLSKSEPSVNFNPFTNSQDVKVSTVEDHAHRLKPQYTPHKRNAIQKAVGVIKPENGSDEHVDDCYSWNKWWQRKILGAKYIRSYYQCAHRKTQGCLATKQVQRHPSVLEIMYSGKHTCTQAIAFDQLKMQSMNSGKHTCTQAIAFDQLQMQNMKFGHVINNSNSMLLPIFSSTPASSEGENCSQGESCLPVLIHSNEGHSVTNLKTSDLSYMSVPRVRTQSTRLLAVGPSHEQPRSDPKLQKTESMFQLPIFELKD